MCCFSRKMGSISSNRSISASKTHDAFFSSYCIYFPLYPPLRTKRTQKESPAQTILDAMAAIEMQEVSSMERGLSTPLGARRPIAAMLNPSRYAGMHLLLSALRPAYWEGSNHPGLLSVQPREEVEGFGFSPSLIWIV